jgi:hypothetical protein
MNFVLTLRRLSSAQYDYTELDKMPKLPDSGEVKFTVRASVGHATKTERLEGLGVVPLLDENTSADVLLKRLRGESVDKAVGTLVSRQGALVWLLRDNVHVRGLLRSTMTLSFAHSAHSVRLCVSQVHSRWLMCSTCYDSQLYLQETSTTRS